MNCPNQILAEKVWGTFSKSSGLLVGEVSKPSRGKLLIRTWHYWKIPMFSIIFIDDFRIKNGDFPPTLNFTFSSTGGFSIRPCSRSQSRTAYSKVQHETCFNNVKKTFQQFWHIPKCRVWFLATIVTCKYHLLQGCVSNTYFTCFYVLTIFHSPQNKMFRAPCRLCNHEERHNALTLFHRLGHQRLQRILQQLWSYRFFWSFAWVKPLDPAPKMM